MHYEVIERNGYGMGEKVMEIVSGDICGGWLVKGRVRAAKLRRVSSFEEAPVHKGVGFVEFSRPRVITAIAVTCFLGYLVLLVYGPAGRDRFSMVERGKFSRKFVFRRRVVRLPYRNLPRCRDLKGPFFLIIFVFI